MDKEFEELIGLTIEEAEERYPDYMIRMISKNGRFGMVTMDWQNNRINVHITEDKITGVQGRG